MGTTRRANDQSSGNVLIGLENNRSQLSSDRSFLPGRYSSKLQKKCRHTPRDICDHLEEITSWIEEIPPHITKISLFSMDITDIGETWYP